MTFRRSTSIWLGLAAALAVTMVPVGPASTSIALVQLGTETGAETGTETSSETRAARRDVLDQLFETLRNSTSEAESEPVSAAIWQTWLSYGDPTVDRNMRSVMRAMSNQRYRTAIALLDAIVRKNPDFAEAWNKRATINYMIGRNDASLADIAKTLALEPRHFGALSGKALILTARGEKKAALDTMRKALEIHPFLSGAREIIERNGGTYEPERGI